MYLLQTPKRLIDVEISKIIKNASANKKEQAIQSAGLCFVAFPPMGGGVPNALQMGYMEICL
jgi:hypothetical protein